MNTKVDYKKIYKELYVPKKTPVIVNVPKILFVTLEGDGDPNGEEFALAVSALYSFTYKVKMSYKSSDVPDGYYDYTVFPLEGVWDLVDKEKGIADKSNFKYKIMIRQPDFLTKDLFERFLEEIKMKKPNDYLDRLVLEEIEEGLCVQMLHVGAYDDEPASIQLMDDFCKANGYIRKLKTHREIYLSDPRKVETAKLKTTIRYQIELIDK